MNIYSSQDKLFPLPLLALQLSKFFTEAIKHVPQMVTYAVVEKEMQYKWEQR